MKQKMFMIMFILAVFLTLVSCSSALTAEPQDDQAAQIASDKVSVAECLSAESGRSQLIYAAQGICLLYPDNFEVFQVEDGSLTLYSGSLLNTESPLANISFEPADGRSLNDLIIEYIPGFDPETDRPQTIELDGETAVVLDNMPGQDINRLIIIPHQDRVIHMMIARIGPEYGVVGEQAEALYAMITATFRFIGIEPEALLLISSN